MIDTRQKLIETAETLFAEQGYGPVSLRQIIGEAGVNLAAVHYHFGSKEDLLDAIVTQKASEVNDERLSLLAAIQPGPDGRLPLRDVLNAFLMPMAAKAEKNPQFLKLMGRIHAEGLLIGVVSRVFHPIFRPFSEALHKAAPHLSADELGWRIHFMMGAVAHTMCQTPKHIPDAAMLPDYATRLHQLSEFLAGAFAAPASETPNLGVKQ